MRVCVCAASSASWPGLDGTRPYVGARRPSLLVSVILARIWRKPRLNSSPNPPSRRKKSTAFCCWSWREKKITPSRRIKRSEVTSRTSFAATNKSGITASDFCLEMERSHTCVLQPKVYLWGSHPFWSMGHLQWQMAGESPEWLTLPTFQAFINGENSVSGPFEVTSRIQLNPQGSKPNDGGVKHPKYVIECHFVLFVVFRRLNVCPMWKFHPSNEA